MVVVVLAVLAVLAVWAVTRTARTEGLKLSAQSLNGEDNKEPHPYYVQTVHTDNGKVTCGGVLIAEDVVLTAAHCFSHGRGKDARYKSKIGQLYCTIGDDNTSKVPEQVEYRYIRRIVVHPNYVKGNSNNVDLALLFLDKKVETKPPIKRVLSEVLLYRTSATKMAENFVAMGRGATNRVIPPYTPTSTFSYGKLGLRFGLREDAVLTAPRDLQAQTPAYVEMSANYTSLVTRTKGSNVFYGDSGGPLLVKIDGVWQLAGIASSGDGEDILGTVSKNDYIATYCNVSIHKHWIDEQIKKDEVGNYESMDKLDTRSITVREIEHVVALTRLKHLKKIAAMKNTTFEDLFLTGEGEAKKRWLNLREYFRSSNDYREIDDSVSKALVGGSASIQKEVQLAVMWAVVSSQENYKVLHEMVTSDSTVEGGGIPYLCRLRYTTGGGEISSGQFEEDGTGKPALLSFDMNYVLGQEAWKARSGVPTLWSTKDTDEKASKAELDLEKKQKTLRDTSRDLKFLSRYLKFLFLEARPLRRRMFCDFTETLREYMSERRPWYPRYFHYNNIDSPSRTAGLYECQSADNADYFDGEGNPKSSYAPGGRQQCDSGHTDVLSDDYGSPVWNFYVPDMFEDDASRAWLQKTNEYWPELTSTTLYDRYEWIEMPDKKRKITFREALFLIRDVQRIEVPDGTLGNNYAVPTLDTGKLNKHPGSNKILQYYPLFLVYLYAYLKTKLGRFALAPVSRYVFREQLRGVMVSEKEIAMHDKFVVGEEYSYIRDKGHLTNAYSTVKITGAGTAVNKNDRILGINKKDKKTETPFGTLSASDIAEFKKNSIYVYPAHSSWVSYPISGSSSADPKVAWADALEPLKKQVNERYLKALPECVPKTAKTPAPADNKKKPPQDEVRGGGGQQELDALLAEIWDCI